MTSTTNTHRRGWRSRSVVLVSSAFLLAAVYFAMSVRSEAGTEQPVQVVPRGNSSLTAARTFTEFPLYYAGESIGTKSLAAVQRILEPKADGVVRHGTNLVNFTYGTCELLGREGGCLPLQIQNKPACLAVQHSYDGIYPGEKLPSEDLSIRGAPASFYENGARLEIYLKDVTVLIGGGDRPTLLKGAAQLVRVNGGSTPSGDPLPPVSQKPSVLTADGMRCRE